MAGVRQAGVARFLPPHEFNNSNTIHEISEAVR